MDKKAKIDAMWLASEPGNTQAEIERDFAIGKEIISRWKSELLNDGDPTFPGKSRQKPGDEELRRLKRENERLHREREIL